MCLTVFKKYKRPKSSRIRWKIVLIDPDCVVSPYMYSVYKQTGNVAKLSGNPREEGFHVFLHRKDAFYGTYSFSSSCVLVAKVRVSGFLQGGVFESKPCETWKRMDFLELYNVIDYARVSEQKVKQLFKGK